MLQAMLEAMLQAKEGDEGGDISPVVNDFTTGDLDVQDVRSTGVMGGSGGPLGGRRRQRKPRQTKPLAFWHDLFRHVNARCQIITGRDYGWDNASRKVLANAARKYGTPAIMAMWDLYVREPAYWFRETGGTIYGMVRDAARLLDHPEFKTRSLDHERRLLQQHKVYDAILNPGGN